MLQELPEQILLGESRFVSIAARSACFFLLRKKRLALPVQESGGHHQEFAGQIEVQLLHELDVRQVLIGDPTDGNPRDIELMALDQIKQEVQGAFETLESDR